MANKFTINLSDEAQEELDEIPRYHKQEIWDKMEEQLSYDPEKETRNKKLLLGRKPPWKGKVPFWELRIGEYRVFYEVDALECSVSVQAIRHKPPHATMEDML